MESMISFATQRRAMGSRELTRRSTNPRETTNGPERQTIPRTGGMLRRAAKRSRQLPDTFVSALKSRPRIRNKNLLFYKALETLTSLIGLSAQKATDRAY